jgi:hypothetical protein
VKEDGWVAGVVASSHQMESVANSLGVKRPITNNAIRSSALLLANLDAFSLQRCEAGVARRQELPGRTGRSGAKRQIVLA